MIATKADLLTVAPCFSSLTDPQFDSAAALYGPHVSDDAWGSDAARARLPQALFLAHCLAFAYPAMAADALLVSSETVASVSRTYAIPSSQNLLALTKWGAQFAALVRALPAFFVP